MKQFGLARTAASAHGNRAAETVNYDTDSAVSAFEQFTMAGWDGYWTPGA